MSTPASKRTNVFISYSHNDMDWLARLRVHLKPLENAYRAIEFWDDTKICSGSLWNDEINNALASTKVVVLLVSADFFASDFIKSNELPPLLNAASKEGVVVLPVIISASMFLQTPELYKFQAANNPARPLIEMSKGEQERTLVDITLKIKAALDSHIVAPTNNDHERIEVFSVEKSDRARFGNKRNAALALIAALVVILAAAGYWLFGSKPARAETVQYSGKVFNETTRDAIPNAKVTVEGLTEQYYSDSKGAFSMTVLKTARNVLVKVEAEGYQLFNKPVALPETRGKDVEFALVKTEPPITPVKPKPELSNRNRPGNANRKKLSAEDLIDKKLHTKQP